MTTSQKASIVLFLSLLVLGMGIPISLQKGIVIEGKKTLPAKVFIKNRNKEETVIKISIIEGRKRQIRRMIKSVGSEVISLKRLQIGNVKLGKLPIGMWRFLLPSEIEALKRLSYRSKKKKK